jgi:hypothetical protein
MSAEWTQNRLSLLIYGEACRPKPERSSWALRAESAELRAKVQALQHQVEDLQGRLNQNSTNSYSSGEAGRRWLLAEVDRRTGIVCCLGPANGSVRRLR